MLAGWAPRKQRLRGCSVCRMFTGEHPPDLTCGRKEGEAGLGSDASGPMTVLAVPTGSPELGRHFRLVLTCTKQAWPLVPVLTRHWMWVAQEGV